MEPAAKCILCYSKAAFKKRTVQSTELKRDETEGGFALTAP